ncbi:response regulator [Microbacterium imperiale]|uniref:Transcriptional regulatory protein KdpE n=1 Tax=Microbacterium imperiale TaxID=33884 RepID=A0A9W6HGZ4_9MICO|nr:response regulator [Microbacterium imperiale]MBP2421127.1 two-component system KDP operon response regulator KdpE [Microbacterium imperiale]MDS0199761.1 response regulator [Microbacterium imperiale]BFE41468.1 response regulator [Microbacterium imperiale]GLJ80419.1 putative transcriptional regulatory protein KdpE [Microbacterium imperiale]
MRILLADDDPQLVRALRITLGAHGYDVVTAADGAAAIAAAASEHPDVIVLDLGMPRLDGVAVIEAVRGWSDIPIIVVSGRTGSADKVTALDAGADDYVTKPFQIDELLARLRALARRTGGAASVPLVRFADVEIDRAAKTVTRAGERVHLTPTEWRMLDFLARSPGALVTRHDLLKELWGTEQVSDTGYLRLYVSQLRKKLEADPAHPAHLLTEAGMGYRLVAS